ncbi:SpaA isopeptide-forming pilin-related protein [Listeria booriae]|uniref:SpaA isopeptide-forming pilin-related protein n=1 Tax=Listeria booriae TaxID=1552123 RepID=UPI0028807730|nr:SpaA isopeptide-forming pilin-related protein [Listeria booriae]MDT0109341.1 SpaA isopeptide-forming pilin-related protein [Listeria booriae]
MISLKKGKIVKLTLAAMIALSSVVGVVGTKAETTSAAAKSTVHILAKDVTYLYGVNSGNPVRMVDRLRDQTNKAVFCINFNLPSPNGLMYDEAERLDNATTYLNDAFFNGNSNLTTDKAYNEYLIQAAIHNIKSPTTFSLTNSSGQEYVDKDGSHTTVNKIKALVAEAKKAGAPNTPVFENSLSVSATSVTAKKIGDKYVSQPVTITTKGNNTLTAKLTNATTNSYVSDENGNKLTSIKNGSKVSIAVPIAEAKGNALQPKVEVAGDFEQGYQVAKRLTGNAGYQDIATYVTETFSEEKKASFVANIQQELGSIKGVKVSDNNKPLANVTIELQNDKGEKLKEFVTKSDGIFEFTNLPFGTYYWLETKSIDGYILNSVKHPVTINYQTQSVVIGDFVNNLKRGKIEGKKVDDEGHALANAEFTLTDNTGEKRTVTTNEEGLFSFTLEALKTYDLEETKLPVGYKNPFEMKNITLENDGDVIEVTAVNNLMKGKIEGLKVDEKGHKLADAEFTLTDDLGKKQVVTTKEDGVFSFDIEALRTYTLKETKLPTGYKTPFELKDITLQNDGEIIKVNAKNELKKGSIEGLKVDKDSNKTLEGAELTLTDDLGKKQVVTTKEDGKFLFEIEANRVYSLKETKVPAGYTGQFEQNNITLKDDGEVIKITVKNAKVKELVKFEVKAKDKVKVVEKVQKEQQKLAKTGDNMNWYLVLFGAVLILGGFIGLRSLKKKKK